MVSTSKGADEMIFEQERRQVVDYGKKLITSGLTKGTGGNISIYLPEEKRMIITPSGMEYFALKPEDILVMDLQGNIIEGDHKPSSEYGMHRIFYEKRTDIRAVVHVHSVFATTMATLGLEIPAMHYLIAVGGGNNIPVAPYATFGTEELAQNAYESMKERFAVLLSNHGLLTGGNTLDSAFSKAEEIEFCAEIYYRSKTIGEPRMLSDKEMEKMVWRFGSYGQGGEEKL